MKALPLYLFSHRLRAETAVLREQLACFEGLRERRELLVGLLTARGFPLTADTQARICASRNFAELGDWILRATTATTIDEVFAGGA